MVDKTEGVQIIKTGAWSAGPGCHGGCGVEVHVKDGRVIKVEGDTGHPFNQGRACPRVLAMTQYIYHPDRLKYPLKRVGKRGEGKWQRISWDEAFDTCEKRMREISEKYGPEAMYFTQGTGRDVGGEVLLLAYAYGSPNWSVFLPGISCWTPRLIGMYSVQADFSWTPDVAAHFPLRYKDPEWVAPKLLIAWGDNIQRGCNCHYWSSQWIVDLMKRGTKLIVVDPICSWEASRADLWLQIRPGTDGALALGMLNIIINEELYDREFVDKWTFGFDKLKERVQDYPPERVADITWLPREKIVQAARMYAENKPAGIITGVPIDMNPEATAVMQAITSLWCITGNLDIPGGQTINRPAFGVAIYPYSTEEVIQLYGEEFVQRLAQKRIGPERFPMYKAFRAWATPEVVLEQMETGKPYPVKGMWCQQSNFLACTAGDPKRHYNATVKLDFNVVVDIFMTPTAQAIADIVLPATSFVEKDSVYSIGTPLNALRKIIEIEECKSDWEINFEMAKRLNPQAVPWKNVREMLTERLKPSGLTFEELCEKPWALPPKDHPSGTSGYRRYEKGLLRPDKKPGFRTSTGRLELYSKFYEGVGLDPLPYYNEPLESPVSTPEVWKEYPLILITGRRTSAFFHSENRQIPWLREIVPDPTVEIHPDTARALGIEDGNWVWIEGRRGRAKRKAKLTPIVHPKMVQALHGWWYPERDGKAPYFNGIWEINVNQLLPAECQSKSGFGGAQFKTTLCRVRKIKEGEE